jgi:hypothetical protein
MSTLNKLREIEILKCVQNTDECTFGDIKKHLEKMKVGFNTKNNMPLSRKLKELEKSKKIRINRKIKPYTTYSIIKNNSSDIAIMGDMFRKNFTKTFFTPVVRIGDDYIKKDIPLRSADNENEKFIKSMVTRYGFYMLSVLVNSYEQSIKLKNFDRKIWINNAMDLMKDEESISNDFLNLLEIPFEYPKPKNQYGKDEDYEILDVDEHPELLDDIEEGEFDEDYEVVDEPPLDLTKRNNKKLLKEKLEKIHIAMEKTYPKMHKSIKLYDAVFKKNPKKIQENLANDMISEMEKDRKEKKS